VGVAAIAAWVWAGRLDMMAAESEGPTRASAPARVAGSGTAGALLVAALPRAVAVRSPWVAGESCPKRLLADACEGIDATAASRAPPSPGQELLVATGEVGTCAERLFATRASDPPCVTATKAAPIPAAAMRASAQTSIDRRLRCEMGGR
jgi:hypothetical protein